LIKGLGIALNPFYFCDKIDFMKYSSRQKAYLVLEDGKVFEGKAVGKIGTTTGEICFNTGMTGYQEIYTDPSYFGQIIVNTSSHIGNYGVHNADVESNRVMFNGLVCKSFSTLSSRLDGDGSLHDYFVSENVVGISDVDTREIVRYIRHKGAMNAIISSNNHDVEDLREILKDVPSMAGLELASKVSTTVPYYLGGEEAKYKVAVLDLGIKTNILRSLVERNCICKVFPAKSTFEEMSVWNPDGYFISNGPGDPSATQYAIGTVRAILDSQKPLFGICLGHQIIALASGVSTYKMFNGHRGINHPVKNLETGLSEITSQNHGFVVSEDDVKESDLVELTHINLNDGTVEGIKIKNKDVFSVQHHPEAAPGPHDSMYLFDNYVSILESNK
jgi:carbamoyl-phosphate synthase small subunit